MRDRVVPYEKYGTFPHVPLAWADIRKHAVYSLFGVLLSSIPPMRIIDRWYTVDVFQDPRPPCGSSFVAFHMKWVCLCCGGR